MWSTKLVKTARMASQNGRMQQLQHERPPRKICRLPEKIQYVDKASSSTDENNWDYNKIESINNTNKKRGDYFHATLFVNKVSTKLIIDSESSVTPIPQRLFDDISEVTKSNPSYKENDTKIEFLKQTRATVKKQTRQHFNYHC